MSRYFAACELGEELGRVMLGTLHKERLTLSEVHRFENVPAREKDAIRWDIAQLYQETLAGLRAVGAYDEPVESISCSGWAADYLLFHSDASFIPPTYHHGGSRTGAGRKEALAKVRWETIYEETGVRDSNQSTLFQLAVEKSRQLKRADHLLPVADGFNFLLSGVPRVELSAASATQLYNPVTKFWSERLLSALKLPAKLFPSVVAAGTKLKPLRPELAKATGLEDAHIVATCSNELAAALVALPVQEGEQWAFLRLGRNAVIGAGLRETIITDESRESNLSHTLGYGGAVYCHTETLGLRLLEECRRYWAELDHALDDSSLAHLAATAEPLESLVNLADPRFATPGDVVPKLQACCRETGQPVPRRPGAIYRCLMESLAFLYRRTLDDITRVTGREFTRVYLLGDSSDNILHHFIANALQLPVVTAPANATSIGNVVVQALAMGRIKSLTEARAIVEQSFKMGTILPHPAATWAPVYERYLELSGIPAHAARA